MCQVHAKFFAQPSCTRRAALSALAVLLMGSTSGPLGCASEPGAGPDEAGEAGETAATAADPETPPAEAPEASDAFSGGLAYQHLLALSEIGDRETGSTGAERARVYLKRELEKVGAQVDELHVLVPDPTPRPPGPDEPRYQQAVHVIALLPGESDDRFLLTAAYDTRRLPRIDFVGANASASGPALLLELARVMSLRPRPYTLMFAFVDADRLPGDVASPVFPGTRALAARLIADPRTGLDAVRLAVVFQQVADVDLGIARDLRSHPIYREFFWEAAGVLGEGAAFPADAAVESVAASHLALIDAGLARTVLISDPRYGGSEVPGRYAASELDTPLRCSPQSLAVVGEVTTLALERIATRLSRIDRFRAAPLQDPFENGSDAAGNGAEGARPAE